MRISQVAAALMLAGCTLNVSVGDGGPASEEASCTGAGCQEGDDAGGGGSGSGGGSACSGRGTMLADGGCACTAPFTGAQCELCPQGYAGTWCQYSDAVTCNGHGAVNAAGGCACTAGFAGEHCDVCAAGHTGPSCQYSDAVTCNGRGVVDVYGACVCTAAFAGAHCETCALGYAGTSCQYSDAVTCNGGGVANAAGGCACAVAFAGARCETCAAGYAGTSCQYSDAVTCTARGVVNASGGCACIAGYGGAHCDNCAPGYAGSSCQYSDAVTCAGRGVVNAVGACACAASYAGASCQYSDAVNCSGHGAAQTSGACACATGWAGASCTSCATGFLGPLCQYSDATTCNSRGTVYANGACSCYTGWGGANCAIPTLWQGLGGSAWGVPHTTALGRSSSSGYGISPTVNVGVPSLVLDASDRPVVAFGTPAGVTGGIVSAVRWTGTAWSGVGTSWATAAGQYVGSTSIGLAATGDPIVTWHTADVTLTGALPYLRVWNGTSWGALGTSDLGYGGALNVGGWNSNYMVMATDSASRPAVAWQQNSTPGGILVKRWDGSAWATFGASAALPASAAGHIPTTPAIAFDASNNPVVAWQETFGATGSWTAPFQIYLRRWDGAAWVELGGSATGGGVSNTGTAGSPWLAIASDGSIFVAWSQTTGEVYLRRWNPISSTWVELGGSASGAGIASGWLPQVALDAAGNPTVAYTCTSGTTSDICAKRWSGSAWVGMDGSGTGGGISKSPAIWSFRPQLRINRADQPVVAWAEDSTVATRSVYARYFDGTRWQSYWEGNAPLEGSLSSDSDDNTGRAPAVALRSSGVPVVAWQDQSSSSYTLKLKSWTGTSWGELGASGTTGILNLGTSAGFTRVALDSSDRPVVAWVDQRSGNWDVYLTRWDGAAWNDYAGSSLSGGLSASAATSTGPSVALDHSGRPIVAWYEYPSVGATASDIYLKRWNGSAWVELGGSATGAGISGTPSYYSTTSRSAVAVDSLDRPVVAWTEYSDATNREVFLKAWNGTSWVELGGSATAGGVSHSAGLASTPQLVLDASDRPIVAWSDNRTGTYQVYVLAWNGSAWQSYGSSSLVSAQPLAAVVVGLSLDDSGRPIVLWSETASGANTEIYVRRWDGAAWVEHGIASGSGGGITNSPTASTVASLSARAGMIGVAWQDWNATNPEVFYRQIRQ